MSLAAAVVAHPDRLDAAEHLADDLDAELFVDTDRLGEWLNHVRALRWAAEQDASHALIVQDDALPIPDFRHHAEKAIAHRPTGLVGFYVGRTCPRAEPVKRAVRTAEKVRASWLCADTLLWGVATAVPTADIPELLAYVQHYQAPYDLRLGRWYRDRGVPVHYTWPSLVEHADGPSLLTRHRHPRQRIAWRVGVPTRWDGPTVRIDES